MKGPPERRLKEELHSATLDSLAQLVAVLDADGTVICVNAALERFVARHPSCDLALGTGYLKRCAARGAADPDRAALAVRLHAMLAGELDSLSATYELEPGARVARWFGVSATLFRGAGSARIVMTHYDRTKLIDAQRAAGVRSQLLDEIEAAIIGASLDGTIELWSRGAERVFGWSADEVVGRRAPEFIVAADEREPASVGLAKLKREGARVSERELLRKDGSRFAGHASSTVHYDQQGAPNGVVSVILDVTERVQAEHDLRSARDHLRAVTDSMGEALCTLRPDGQVGYMNPAAERLLGWTAAELGDRTLHEAVHYRRSDGSPYPLSDCAICNGHIAREVVRVDDDTFVRRDGTDVPVAWVLMPVESLAEAESVLVFTDNSRARAERERLRREVEQLSAVRELHEALQEERFELFAQPIIDLATNAVVSHELLLRMRGRDGGLRSPATFLPAAERCGLIGELDRWVIGEAARHAGAGHRVELNLSAISLGDPDLFEHFAAAVAAHGAEPGRIGVELTETAVIGDEAIAGSFVERIRALGCELSLDDFGTGFGGFGYLKRLPVDRLKIDVEFVRDLRTNAASRHLLEAVVNLAGAFGQRTVAEGVEDAETLELVRSMGVDLAQGYGIGRPGPLEQTLLC